MASTYLQKVPSSVGSTTTGTFSFWVKITGTGTQAIYTVNDGASQFDIYIRNASGQLDFYAYSGPSSSYTFRLHTSRLLRDHSAWYHIVCKIDLTNSTQSDRAILYINGVRETAFSIETYPSDASQTAIFSKNSTTTIGAAHSGSNDFDGCLSHFHFCDGYAYDASTFGSTDATTGEWKINTNPNVQYGTNGFFLFKDNASTTDQSGQGNNWSVTAGTLTKTEDNPSNVFCTMNPLMINPSATNTFANGNNTVTINATDASVGATLGASSGKFYWEQKWTQQGANDRWGVCPDDAVMTNHPRTTGIGWDTASTQFYLLGSAVSGSWGGSIGTSEIIQIALDLDNSALYLGVNGTWRNSGSPTSGSSRTGAVNFSSSSLVGKFLLPAFGKGNQDNSTMQYNFGNGYFGTTAVSSAGTNASGIGIFEYDVPTGFTALSTKGLNL
jgi:hypothetical protein